MCCQDVCLLFPGHRHEKPNKGLGTEALVSRSIVSYLPQAQRTEPNQGGAVAENTHNVLVRDMLTGPAQDRGSWSRSKCQGNIFPRSSAGRGGSSTSDISLRHKKHPNNCQSLPSAVFTTDRETGYRLKSLSSRGPHRSHSSSQRDPKATLRGQKAAHGREARTERDRARKGLKPGRTTLDGSWDFHSSPAFVTQLTGWGLVPVGRQVTKLIPEFDDSSLG